MDRPSDAVDAYRAMILNSKRMASGDPAILELARNGGEGEDPAVFAKQLQDALAEQKTAMAEQMKANPRMFRERLMSRRQRNAG